MATNSNEQVETFDFFETINFKQWIDIELLAQVGTKIQITLE